MTDKTLRWGILGVAKINERLIPAFQKAKLGRLVGIASRDLARAQAAAAVSEIPMAFGSYHDMLKCPDIDAVYIPLPNTIHGEWTRFAADAGKHVLCEKPLTPTAPEARELVDYCQARGVQLMDGFMWPHHPRTAMIRRLLDDGVIGTVQRVGGAFTFPLELNPDNIRLKQDMAGGSLLDVGCYPVYGIRWAFGEEPVRVYATARYDYEVDLEMNGILCFADGRVGTFDCGFTLPMRQWLEITGTKGVVRVRDLWLPDAEAKFEIEHADSRVETVVVPGHDQIVHMIDDFSRAVLSGVSVEPSPEQAVRSALVMDALARSAAEEREIDV